MERIHRWAWQDALIATLLAGVLTAAWAWRDWTNLSALRLPDADDAMRLQQVRDWLGGQPFGDLTQYRLGPSGTAMHWTRLDDLVPAAIIRIVEGAAGRHAAELVAIIVWPAVLLATAIGLVARIARQLAGDETVMPAMVVAAIAYPAIPLFAPGRIDHHNLQMVLMLVIASALAGRSTMRAGVIAGGATALSLVIGMETAPLLVVAAGVFGLRWVGRGEPERRPLAAFALSLIATTAAASGMFAPVGWARVACDGFTVSATQTAVIGGMLMLGLAGLPIASARTRAVAAIVGGTAALAVIAIAVPQCLNPYGGVDPLLRRLWLARVGEATPLLRAPPAIAIGYIGLPLAGIGAAAWFAWRSASPGWLALLALQLGSLAVAFVQLRGAYAGALIAAPALGALIAAARRRGMPSLAGAWLASAGILYPLAAQAWLPSTAARPGPACASADLITALNALPTGTVMAPIDTGGPAIAATGHRFIAGAYHRDTAGNLAMYRFYLGRPDTAHRIARRLGVTYVISCDGLAARPAADSFASQMSRAGAPPWLRRVATTPDGAVVYRTVGL